MMGRRRQTVLVVDDDDIGRELVGSNLESRYRVVTAADGAEALEQLDRGPVDLVILDVMMPRMDGFEACRQIKTRGGVFLPVILLTALHGQDDRNRGLSVGADEFLSKPIDTRELHLRAAALLRLRAQEQTIRRQSKELEKANRKLIDHSDSLERAVRERTAELARQNRLTNQIVDSLPVSLYVVDRDYRVAAWNHKRELGTLGIPRDEALGRQLFELFGSRPREEVEREIDEVFESGETVCFESESTFGPSQRLYRIQRLPMSLDTGQLTHVLTIGEDITERRRMQESMAMTEKMAAVGQLAAGVAHEVNNPLATIVTCAEALGGRIEELLAGQADPAEFREYLEIVQQEAFRAKKISEGLLDFSRAQPTERERHSLESICERTLQVLKHHAGFKTVDVRRDFAGPVPDVDVEADAIVQALIALVINALDAMPDGGTLELATRAEGDQVRCEVRDTGCGMPPEVLGRVFEPFFTTKPPGRGTGLGLAVCFGIVQRHGGRLDVESTAGAGTTFSLVLPAVHAEALAREEALG